MDVSLVCSRHHLGKADFRRQPLSFRVLHIPTFRDDVAAFLSSPLINPLSITEAARVALVAACLAATLHLVDDPIELQGLGHATEESRAAEVKRLSDLMEMTMFRSDWMQHHRIEWLQAYMWVSETFELIVHS